MYKKQAIDLLDNLIGMVEDNQKNDYDTALRMAIDALKAQLSSEGTTSDLISRHAAIDALGEKPLAWNSGEYELGMINQWESDVDAIKSLPSAQPEIVHCGECARRRAMCDGRDRCTVFNVIVDEDGYCKWAEMRRDSRR